MERFSINEAAASITIRMNGEIVMDVIRELRGEVALYLQEYDLETVVVDLGDLEFMDSSGIGFFIGLKKQLQKEARTLRLHNPSPAIAKLFCMLKLDEYFQMETGGPAAQSA